MVFGGRVIQPFLTALQGLTVLISAYYVRSEQQTRFAFLQSGEVIILATGGIVNFGLNQLDGRGALGAGEEHEIRPRVELINGPTGWRYMFLVQGSITILLSFMTYFWMVDFPEQAHKSLFFLTAEEQALAVARINRDRRDVEAESFAWKKVLRHGTDPKVYAFACMFFLLNMVTTSLSYFLPIILQSGFGFSENKSILLAAPPYVKQRWGTGRIASQTLVVYSWAQQFG